MTSRYYTINELDGKPHQTSALDVRDAQRIAVVVAFLMRHYIDRADWNEPIIRKGSITLQHMREPHHVIKIFIDYGAVLWDKFAIDEAPPTDNPMVVGIELTALGPFEREVVRDALKSKFRYYIDPRQAWASKWWLKPVEGHKYDLVILERGSCDDVSSELVEELTIRITEELPMASEQEI